MSQIRCALLAVLLVASSPGWAQNVLAITPFDAGTNQQADDHVTRLQSIYTSAFDYDVQRAVAIPDFGTLQNYRHIWDIWAGPTEAHPGGKPLTTVEIDLYVEYLANGGRLVVFGDHIGFPTRNNSILALIQAAGAGTLTFTSPTHTEGIQSPQIIQPPFTGPQVIGDGNNEVTFLAAGGTTNAGKGQFISKDNLGRGTALVFGPGTMSNARDGALIVIFDMNIMDAAGPTRPDFSDYGRLLNNIANYLNEVQALPPLADVAALQCRVSDGGALAPCTFGTPMGVVARDGNVYVADTALHAVYKIDSETKQKVRIAGLQLDAADAPDVRYNGDGIDGRQALLNNPTGLALDDAGNLYIADTGNHAIRRLPADATGAVPEGAVIMTIAGVPTQFGVGDPLLLFGPRGITVDQEGNLFIADTMNQQIRKRTADGTLSVVAGIAGLPGGNDGPVTCTPPCTTPPGRLNKPVGVAVDSQGRVFVADEGNNRVRMVENNFVRGTTTANPLRRPTAVILRNATRLLAADYGHHVIRQVVPCDGDCSSPEPDVVAGTDNEAGSSATSLNSPIGISLDDGTLYIADLLNNRIGVVELND